MSKTNKHHSNSLLSIAVDYIKDLFNSLTRCPRRGCDGVMIEVWTRYKAQGPLNKEQECTSCGKVIKDPKFKAQREAEWKERVARRKRKAESKNAPNNRSSKRR